MIVPAELVNSCVAQARCGTNMYSYSNGDEGGIMRFQHLHDKCECACKNIDHVMRLRATVMWLWSDGRGLPTHLGTGKRRIWRLESLCDMLQQGGATSTSPRSL